MTLQRELHIISGNVQGVGFRPFIYTTALTCALTGFVQNTHEGVRIEIQGQPEQLKTFNQKFEDSLPPLALIASHQREALPPLQDEKDFSILHSSGQKGHNVFIGPDVAICQECLKDIFSPSDRRYLYPFTNCTNCGPRYSIIRSIPYDRASTSMACFPLCEQCAEEYKDPTNRRFHAQPNACPKCGPHVWYVSAQEVQSGDTAIGTGCHTSIDEGGTCTPPSPSAISHAVRLVIEGKILALKGLGGFHLVCLAHSQEAVSSLRQRKHRPHKPFALMTASLQDARNIVAVSSQAEALLTSPAHPIVLCPKKFPVALAEQDESFVVKANVFAGQDDAPTGQTGSLAGHTDSLENKTATSCHPPLSDLDSNKPLLPNNIAPDTNFFGIMLPYTPLHHIFMAELQDQLKKQQLPHPPIVVMTSGNLGGEPICLENREALAKLSDLADGFLLHNRDILIRVDDSVVAPQADNSITIFRRARGYAPSPIPLPPCTPSAPPPVLSPVSSHPPVSTPCAHTDISPVALPTVLGLGAELKNTICLNKASNAFMSQHLGDMQHIEATGFHDEIVEHLQNTLAVTPSLVVHDKHPNYYTTQKAEDLGYPSLALQHHAAHAFALLGENPVDEPCLVLALDGTGYGDDGTLWGGEALWVHSQTGEYERLGAFSPLPLPGGEAAIAEPWRMAHALCLQNAIDPGPFPWLPSHAETARHIPMMLEKSINTPVSTSCGRLFDAVSALLGQGVSVSYEGQAAIRLENLALQSAGLTDIAHLGISHLGMAHSNLAYTDLTDPDRARCAPSRYGRAKQNQQKRGQVAQLPCPLHMHNGFCTLNTNKLFVGVCEEIAAGIPLADVALSFHQSLVTGLAIWAKTLCASHGLHYVGLTGGCFNNSLLLTGLKDALAHCGLQALTHHKLPHGDGNIAYGQVVWGTIMSQRKGKSKQRREKTNR